MPQHRMRVSSCVDVLSAAVAQLNETDMNSERAFEHTLSVLLIGSSERVEP